MKITYIKFSNYKSFFNAEIDDLKQVNLIFGYNNSGKSNFLKFIELIFKRKRNIKDDISYEDENGITRVIKRGQLGNFWEGIIENKPFIFSNDDRDNSVISFEIKLEINYSELQDNSNFMNNIKNVFSANNSEFFELSLKGTITSVNVMDSEIKLIESKINNSFIYFWNTDKNDAEYFTDLKNNEFFKKNSFPVFVFLFSKLNDSVLFLDNDRYFNEMEVKTDTSLLSPKNFKNWLFDFYLNPQKHQQYNTYLKFIDLFKPKGTHSQNKVERFNPIKNYHPEFGKLSDSIEIMLSNNLNRLPINAYGSGIQQVLYILSKLFETESKIILIEELELNLSPKYQKELAQHIYLKLIGNNNYTQNQLFFTTHTPHLSYLNHYQILEITMNGEGKSTINKSNRAELRKYSGCKHLSK